MMDSVFRAHQNSFAVFQCAPRQSIHQSNLSFLAFFVIESIIIFISFQSFSFFLPASLESIINIIHGILSFFSLFLLRARAARARIWNSFVDHPRRHRASSIIIDKFHHHHNKRHFRFDDACVYGIFGVIDDPDHSGDDGWARLTRRRRRFIVVLRFILMVGATNYRLVFIFIFIPWPIIDHDRHKNNLKIRHQQQAADGTWRRDSIAWHGSVASLYLFLDGQGGGRSSSAGADMRTGEQTRTDGRTDDRQMDEQTDMEGGGGHEPIGVNGQTDISERSDLRHLSMAKRKDKINIIKTP